MRDRIIAILIKTICDIIAILFVFSKLSSGITNILNKFNVTSQGAITNIISSIAVLLSSLVFVFFEWLIFYVIFKPVNIQIRFLSKNNNVIKQILFDDDKNIMNTQKQYKIEVSISGGNKITNKLIYMLGGDIIIRYKPSAYDTEESDGWVNSSCGSLYKDKEGNMRYYWTDCVKDSKEISGQDPIVLKPDLIIKPRRFDVHKCNVDIKIGSSKRKCKAFQFAFFILKISIVKYYVQPFKIIMNIR